MTNQAKIIYMGTPDFAVPALSLLFEAGYDITYVVTQPDRPRGRGHKLAPSPVKSKALELGLKVLQPERIRGDDDFVAALREASPDLIVVAAYGKILTKEVLDIPQLGCVNIHASLLPKYRGAAPVHRAIEAGEEETGVTLMYMSEGLDEGDMIASSSISVGAMNSGQVTDRLAQAGAELLISRMDLILSGRAHRTPQDDASSTYARPVSKDEGHIDFSDSARAVVRKVRAMTPQPGAFAYLGGEKVRIIEAECAGSNEETKTDAGMDDAPGTIENGETDGVLVSTGKGLVVFKTIQMPGKKPVKVKDYLRGNSFGAKRFE
ncbi:MAG: methionyl-tRNA formyltransferase [Clostridiales Family XIII bacterium]|jgi:methionyl-tRNA formyltransferase|nr:methionyl-tRNA formyltransferase [Clostridiales Family XIII bacterium]